MIDAFYTFGWNYKAWENPFRRLKFDFLSPDMRILEIGASRYSIASLAFDGIVDEIVVGYYDEQEKDGSWWVNNNNTNIQTVNTKTQNKYNTT